jgi:hypothetical protein
MSEPVRKPPVAMAERESGKPHSIRFTNSQWDAFIFAAAARGFGVTEYIRKCAVVGHSYLAAQETMWKSERA